MSVITYRCTREMHFKLKELAARREISLNTLLESILDAEVRKSGIKLPPGGLESQQKTTSEAPTPRP